MTNVAKWKTKPPKWCVGMAEYPDPVYGCKGGPEFSGPALARAAWGEGADIPNSGLIALAYLYRRFGPTPWGSDSHKDICEYVIGTPMDGVYATIAPRGSGLSHGVGFVAAESVRDAIFKPWQDWVGSMDEWAMENGYENSFHLGHVESKEAKAIYAAGKEKLGQCPRPNHEDWRDDPGPCGDLNRAIYSALHEMLRPVYCRDVAINILGTTDEECDEPAAPSKYAGLGVSIEALEELLKGD